MNTNEDQQKVDINEKIRAQHNQCIRDKIKRAIGEARNFCSSAVTL